MTKTKIEKVALIRWVDLIPYILALWVKFKGFCWLDTDITSRSNALHYGIFKMPYTIIILQFENVVIFCMFLDSYQVIFVVSLTSHVKIYDTCYDEYTKYIKWKTRPTSTTSKVKEVNWHMEMAFLLWRFCRSI